MTLLSVGIGRVVFKILPEDILKIAEVVLFAGFGLKLLWDAQKMPASQENDEAEEAEAIVQQADSKLRGSSAIAIVIEALTLVFVAEWGDRTQLTTIFLAAAPNLNAVGVTLGAILGHAITAIIAVVSGRMVAQYLSEKLLFRLSGALFLVFAGMALLQSLGLMR
jgi:putative Ca2+/H+ antiporter (TMEM165/GDT1 family)